MGRDPGLGMPIPPEAVREEGIGMLVHGWSDGVVEHERFAWGQG